MLYTFVSRDSFLFLTLNTVHVNECFLLEETFIWKRHFNECCGHKALSRGNNSNYPIASHGHRQKHLDPIKFRQSKLPIEIF